MLVVLRLTVRRLAIETLVCLATGIVLAAAGYALALQIADAPTAEAGQAWMGLVPYAKDVLVVAPILVAILLGISLAASELERGTAAFAWSIASSRWRWLGETAACGALIVLVVAIPLAWASQELSAALGPVVDARSAGWVDPAWSLVLVRPLLAYALAWIVGVMVGRSLPALLVVILAAGIVLGWLELGFASARSAVAMSIDPEAPGTLWVSDSIQLPDGRILPLADAAALLRPGSAADPPFAPVTLGLAPSQRLHVLALEIAGSLAAAGIVFVGAGIVVEQRRPG